MKIQNKYSFTVVNRGSLWASLVAQTVKNLPAMWETWVGSSGQEDTLEKGMATHCSILAWRTPWTEESGRLHTVHMVAKSQRNTFTLLLYKLNFYSLFRVLTEIIFHNILFLEQ